MSNLLVFGVGALKVPCRRKLFSSECRWTFGKDVDFHRRRSEQRKWVWESKYANWKPCGFGVTKDWNRNLTEITRVFFGGKGRGRLDEFRLMAASMAIISCSYIFLILQHSTRMKWGRVLFITQFRIYCSSKRDRFFFRQTLKSTKKINLNNTTLNVQYRLLYNSISRT